MTQASDLEDQVAGDIADILLQGGALSPRMFARYLLRPSGPLTAQLQRLRDRHEAVRLRHREARATFQEIVSMAPPISEMSELTRQMIARARRELMREASGGNKNKG